ncbi:hypothetical protein VZT92_007775 [Zoarces viviparus]|uniref:Uncharacterized protein n=1 Tax=Zoarces viviparus TaxID=48416 RepID=A0AAW1FLM4_ZOAVI
MSAPPPPQFLCEQTAPESVQQLQERNQAEASGRPNDVASSPSKGMTEEGAGTMSGIMTQWDTWDLW